MSQLMSIAASEPSARLTASPRVAPTRQHARPNKYVTQQPASACMTSPTVTASGEVRHASSTTAPTASRQSATTDSGRTASTRGRRRDASATNGGRMIPTAVCSSRASGKATLVCGKTPTLSTQVSSSMIAATTPHRTVTRRRSAAPISCDRVPGRALPLSLPTIACPTMSPVRLAMPRRAPHARAPPRPRDACGAAAKRRPT